MVHPQCDAGAVGQHRRDFHRGFVYPVVDGGHDLAAQGHHVGAVDDLVGVFRFAGTTEDQAGGAAVVDAELGLQAVHRFFLAGELQHQRVNAQLQPLDVLGLHATLAQLGAGVDAGVDHDAAGKGFVGVEADLKTLTQLTMDLIPVALGGDHLGKAARRLDGARAGGEALLRHEGGHQAGTGRTTGVEGLGHGAELLTQAHRLRGGNAQGHGGLLGVQSQQTRARSGRAQHAGGARDVPAAVIVVGVDAVAHAASHINAQHQGVNHLAARRPGFFGQGQHSRRDRASRVDDGLEVGVVKVKGVRTDAVDQCRTGDIDALAATGQCGLRGRLQHLHGGQGRFSRLVVRCAHGTAQPVQEGAVRLMVHRVAPTPRGVGGHEAGQGLGDGRGVVVGIDLGVAGHEDS